MTGDEFFRLKIGDVISYTSPDYIIHINIVTRFIHGNRTTVVAKVLYTNAAPNSPYLRMDSEILLDIQDAPLTELIE